MRKKILLFFLCCLIVSCTNLPESKSTQFIVQDALQRTIEFSKYPEKIVIVGKQTPMIANFFYLFPLRIERILAIENRSQSPDKFLEIIDDEYPTRLLLEKGAGVEQIAPLEPDLVILKTSMKDEIGVGLEEVGIPVVYVSFEDIETIYRDIQVIGEILDERGRAEKIVQEYQQKLSKIDVNIKTASDTRDVLLLQSANTDQKFSFQVPSRNWLQTQMIEDLNSNPIWVSAALSGGWTEVNFEQILDWSPDDIFIINYRGQSDEIIKVLQNNDIWKSFLSENNINIAPFPYDFISWDQPDPRWILGYSWMASQLYPEQIGREHLLETIRDFYMFFYDMKSDYIDSEIIPLITDFLH